jgi:DNA segregation ATPase FtsK/SpoIIIE, S-DNA-T family
MAKKKKHTKSKKKKEEQKEPSGFWPLAGALIMMLLGGFLLLGGFGAGGPLPEGLFNATYSAFGWAAYLTPLALFSLGAWKFISEDKQIPLEKFASMIGLVVFSASMLFTAFAYEDASSNQLVGGHGGTVGDLIGGTTLSAITAIPASVMFFVLALLSFFLAFNISPKVLMKLLEPFRRKKEDTDLDDLKKNAEDKAFQMNEGVPVEHHRGSAAAIRNTAEKLAPSQDHSALTVASDPSWQLPSVDLLIQKQDKADAGDVEGNAKIIKESFANFNIDVDMEGANIGPRVTQFTLKPPNGVRLTKIVALENNLALDLAATSIRIEAPIPGKRAVGIEVPNVKPAMVRISSLLQSDDWSKITGPLGFCIGKDISGSPIVGDLAKMPHLLVAGQTGSGKSVMINAILTSLLYRNSPSDLKLVLVDPKRVELKPYDDIPHLLTPVITEPEKCISALKWTVAEMERRYRALSEMHVRNIVEYNNQKQEEGMPYIVIVIDELSDLMMMAARDVEALIVRIAQKARAVGIHLILATQRPSVDVITGLIKANMPARIAFAVASQVDSRTIIDQMGAEKLLGSGDMLLLTAEMPKPKRVQGAFISDEETQKVTKFIREQREPQYDDEVVSQPVQLNGRGGVVASMDDGVDDAMWKDAVGVVVQARKASTSLLQRRLRVGYARAARLIETMEERGIVSQADGSRPREVLVNSVEEVLATPEAPTQTQVSAADEVLDENFPDEPDLDQQG